MCNICQWSHVLHSSELQFNLSVGIIGVIYLGCELIHTVGIISAGQVTERLVIFFNIRVRKGIFKNSQHVQTKKAYHWDEILLIRVTNLHWIVASGCF